MSNPNVPGRAFLAGLFALALAAAWPLAARAEAAEQPEAGATEPSDDEPSAEGVAPEEEEAAAPAADAASHSEALCTRLDDLMATGLSHAERGKAAETRAALHCPPASRATQAAETPPPAKR